MPDDLETSEIVLILFVVVAVQGDSIDVQGLRIDETGPTNERPVVETVIDENVVEFVDGLNMMAIVDGLAVVVAIVYVDPVLGLVVSAGGVAVVEEMTQVTVILVIVADQVVEI